MSAWIEAVERNLIPLSKSQRLNEALEEWYYTGNNEDYEAPEERCQLCEQEDLRYHFEIENHRTHGVLWVGSKCIERFSIRAMGPHGHLLDVDESAKVVRADRAKLIKSAEEKAVRRLLTELKEQDEKFPIESLQAYYETRGAFTPNQLALIVWRLQENDLSGRGFGLKMTIKRDREKSQLHSMKAWQLKRLLPYMTTAQRVWIAKRRTDLGT